VNLFFFHDAILVGERSLSITPLARHLAPKFACPTLIPPMYF
jgi:hypothetical protein